MLSEGLYRQVFPGGEKKPIAALVELSRKHLQQHQLPIDETRPLKEELNQLKLPKLMGSNIEEHFACMGQLVGAPYLDMLDSIESELTRNRKVKWQMTPGWVKYSLDGDAIGSVPFPEEDILVFDVETMPAIGPHPLLAVALGKCFIYGWTSSLVSTNSTNAVPESMELIPMNEERPTVVIGHNVSYDRARIQGEYEIKGSPRRFVDTMALHIAVAGHCNQQRPTVSARRKELKEEGEHREQTEGEWLDVTSMNSLADCVRLHCSATLDKAVRDDILLKKTGTVDDVRNNFQEVMDYCFGDVAATRALFGHLWGAFRREIAPHAVSAAAILEMGSCFLPVDGRWKEYIARCETMLLKAQEKVEEQLRQLVEQAVLSPATDPWTSQLDWTPVPSRYGKKSGKAIGTEALFGKPAWYKKLWAGGKIHITSKTRILPLLLKMRWKGQPVCWDDDLGWCTLTKERIPHGETEGANVGSLMTKHFLGCFDKGQLSTDDPKSSAIIRTLMELNTTFAFWIGYRERIKQQLVIPVPPVEGQESSMGIMLPTTVTMGTVTRRAVEPLWMTATNAKKNMVGSELKSLIVAPPGYLFVGADVDSQELWIASTLGDARFGFAGATAIGWMTLQGEKADGTDLHSRTASILGMKRDDAKVFNYGRIYGAGATYAAQLLQKFNPLLSQEEAKEKAGQLYAATKGIKKFLAKKEDSERWPYLYWGGSESVMFNVLEEIARSRDPPSSTPALGCRISRALAVASIKGDEYLTSRVNWAVQSSGVDYLHMLIVSMSYLIQKYAIDARLVLTIHDEVRFMVSQQDQLRAAWALQISNLWTRAMFAHRLGMHDLPLCVAFFSAIDFDHVLRKEAHADCITPSNDKAVPPGHAMDIYKLLRTLKEASLGSEDIIWAKKESRFLSRTIAGESPKPLISVERDISKLQLQLFGPPSKKSLSLSLDNDGKPKARKTANSTEANSSSIASRTIDQAPVRPSKPRATKTTVEGLDMDALENSSIFRKR